MFTHLAGNGYASKLGMREQFSFVKLDFVEKNASCERFGFSISQRGREVQIFLSKTNWKL